MGKVIDIDIKRPYKLSIVICLKCFSRWTAVRPECTRLVDIECSKCGQGFVIETGENISMLKQMEHE